MVNEHLREVKIGALILDTDFESLDDYIVGALSDSTSEDEVLGICMNEGCDCVTCCASNSEDSLCKTCNTKSVSSSIVLMYSVN